MNPKFAKIEEEIERFSFAFPILQNLDHYFSSSNFLSGAKIGWHCHLTSITAATVKVLLKAGAKLYMSECNSATSDHPSIEYMRHLGAQIFLGADSAQQVLNEKPYVISDTGFVLTEKYLRDFAGSEPFLYAGCEITTSGIQKMHALENLDFPVININDGELKTLIENFHGVGDGALEALFRITGRMWAGRSVAVVGYGRVGAGVASYLRHTGAVVSIVENDPTRRLVAHYDGFSTRTLSSALSTSELLITATGRHALIRAELLNDFRDGLVLMNVGHWAEELDLLSIKQACQSHLQVREHLEQFEMPTKNAAGEGSTRRLFVIGGGGPANVVMLAGSPEPTLIHLTTELLCMNHLLQLKAEGQTLAPGEHAVPRAVQSQASLLALKSLGLD